MVEAALPSTLVRALHLLFAAPYATLEAAGGVADRMLNIVATLATYPAVADELVRADALYLLFAAVSCECSLQHRRMRDRITVVMLTFIKMHTTPAVANYASNKVWKGRVEGGRGDREGGKRREGARESFFIQ
jgi:ABC-type spermidine/putrescine transport system permease subunit II